MEKPNEMWAEHHETDDGRDPGRVRAEIRQAAGIYQRGNNQPSEQKHRPVFRQHAGGCADTGQHAVKRFAGRV
jgi:hypothetical protein